MKSIFLSGCQSKVMSLRVILKLSSNFVFLLLCKFLLASLLRLLCNSYYMGHPCVHEYISQMGAVIVWFGSN